MHIAIFVDSPRRHLELFPIVAPIDMPQGGTSKWNVGVREYPAFAEHAEPMVANGSSGISDTGLTLRAFLPIDGQGNRSSIHRYEGPATIADIRAICVRPNIGILSSRLVFTSNNSRSGSLEVSGHVSIPTDLLEKAAESGVIPGPLQNFTCSTSHITQDPDRKYNDSDWELSVCQMGWAGARYLSNAFTFFGDAGASSNTTAPSYLLVNLTIMPKLLYTVPQIADLPKLQQTFNESLAGLEYRARNDWTDVSKKLSPSDGMLSFSLCFPASQTRYTKIIASSKVPPVQPRFRYDTKNGRIQFDDVRKQMLSSLNTTVKQRGILSLQPSQSRDMSQLNPPYLGERDMGIAMNVDPYEGNLTANLLQKYDRPGGRADISIGGLLLEILREGGTTAEAVQSMMTTLLASRYQDYVFLGGTGDVVDASRADFVTVQVPGGAARDVNCAAGATRSYMLVMAAILLHVLTVSFVVVWFCKGKCMQLSLPTMLTHAATNATYLLESWSSISQVYSEMTVPYFKRAAFARDWEVETWMEHKKLHKEAIVIERSTAIQRAPSTTGSLRARKGFVEIGETDFEQDFSSGVRSTQASETELTYSTERERRSSVSSCSESSVNFQEGNLGSRP